MFILATQQKFNKDIPIVFGNAKAVPASRSETSCLAVFSCQIKLPISFLQESSRWDRQIPGKLHSYANPRLTPPKIESQPMAQHHPNPKKGEQRTGSR